MVDFSERNSRAGGIVSAVVFNSADAIAGRR